MANHYPEAIRPNIKMIDISIVNLKDADRANEIFQRGVSVLKKNEAKEVLARMYSAICDRLNTRPDN